MKRKSITLLIICIGVLSPTFVYSQQSQIAENIDKYLSLRTLLPTEFYFPFRDGKVIFILGENGKTTKVNLHYKGEDHFAERVVK